MRHISDLVTSFGTLSIILYVAFIAALAIGYIYKAKFRRSKFVEYLGNVSPEDDTNKTKTSRPASVSH